MPLPFGRGIFKDGGLFSVILGNSAGAVSQQEEPQIIDLLLQETAVICFGNLHAGIHPFEHHGVIGDIIVIEQGFLTANKGLMRDDADIVGVEDQGIAGDTGGGLIGLAEAAVDYDQLTVALDGAFTLLGLDGNMTVDDVAVGAFQTEFL